LGTAAVGLVVCGSLTPFQFDTAALSAGISAWLNRVEWISPAPEDVIVNLLVYVPVGVTFCGWLRRVSGVRTIALPAATVLACVLSLLIELLQTAAPPRCASWLDVLLNTYGAMIGAALAPSVLRAADRTIERLRDVFGRSHMAAAGVLLTAGLILHGLAPFDFTMDSDSFSRSLLQSRWWPIAERPASLRVPPAYLFEPIFSAVAGAGLFAGLAVITALLLRQRNQSPQTAFWRAVGHASLVALIIETLQLFVRSRVFDTLDILAAVLGAGLGAWFAVGVVAPARSEPPPTPAQKKRRGRLYELAIAAQVSFMLTRAAAPFDFALDAASLSAVRWAPFAAFFEMPFPAALGSLISLGLAYLLLAAVIAARQWRCQNRIRWARVTCAVIVVALSTQLLQLLSTVRVPDLTQPMVAFLAAWTCRLLWLRASQVRARSSAA
jgi:glycopeptide antibiotics resistance protein